MMTHRSVTEVGSSSGIRDAIVAQHGALRDLLAETIELADERTMSEIERQRLRTRARELYGTLEAHLSFEEDALAAALRDVIGRGAVLRARIEEDHAHQRVALASARSVLEPGGADGPSWAELVESVRAFASAILPDFVDEEEHLLEADLDALATDAEGG